MKRATRALVVMTVFLMGAAATGAALDVTSEIVAPAQKWTGSSYCFGSASPDCFDCSGFVNYIYKPHVPKLPRSSRDMAKFGDPVPRRQIAPGDLVFFATGPDPSIVSHVAIYIGQNSIIHAISDGPERGVTVTPLSARYWRKRYHSARRVLPTASTGGEARRPIEYAKGTYTGELKAGEPHGTGVLRMSNGDRYEGEFEDGVFHGQGTYTWADGRTYEGRFENGRIAEKPAETDTDTETAERRTYLEEEDSPWNDWDGVVRGDFAAWWDQEQSEFEQWKAEQDDY